MKVLYRASLTFLRHVDRFLCKKVVVLLAFLGIPGQCACEREAQVLGFLFLFQLNTYDLFQLDAVDLVHCIDGLVLFIILISSHYKG